MRERRKNKRHVKRTQVRFWIEGDPTTRTGITRDISGTGAFVGTNHPSPRGTRLRIEIGTGESTLVIEGVVARRIQIAPELRQLGDSGMGVRFLTPEELIGTLLYGDGKIAAAAKKKKKAGKSEGNIYPVHFESPRDFLEVFVKDIASGGLFIATPDPAPLDAEVTVELHPPGAEEKTIQVPARVVQRVEGEEPTGGIQGPEGMGVAFSKPSEVLRQLEPHIERLRGPA